MKHVKYICGGAVRDILLGLEPKDIDFVWIDSCEQHMESLGFTRVGASFPVYLDQDGNEHALARQERKTGTGYNGFEVITKNVSIFDDLERRDLTCNSIAVHCSNWDEFVRTQDRSLLIDPFNGYHDIQARILRHTSNAFNEDPVRVLRVSRFTARYGFTVHPETIELMAQIVPELNDVPNERIWKEFEKGLMENHPSKMIDVLQMCRAFEQPCLSPYSKSNTVALDLVEPYDDLCTRFVAIGHGFTPEDYVMCKIPGDCAQISLIINKLPSFFLYYSSYFNDTKLKILGELKVFNNLTLLTKVLKGLRFLHRMNDVQLIESIKLLEHDLFLFSLINVQKIIESCKSGSEIKQKLYNARISALQGENEHT